ncbi:hypothetical protein BJX65DRAFT_39860 [Aspergillus insuetus]
MTIASHLRALEAGRFTLLPLLPSTPLHNSSRALPRTRAQNGARSPMSQSTTPSRLPRLLSNNSLSILHPFRNRRFWNSDANGRAADPELLSGE